MCLAWLLTSCAMTSGSKSVFLAENLALMLTAPPAEKIATVDSHLVEITSKGKKHQFIAQVEYHANEIAMAAISPSGLPLFDFTWFSDKTTEVNQYVPLPNIDIRFIIADIQLCNWPLSVLRTAIIGSNVSIKQHLAIETKNVIWQRAIMQNNQVIIKINKFENGYELENLIRGYQIRLTNLERDYS
jgi:hypothetical protein